MRTLVVCLLITLAGCGEPGGEFPQHFLLQEDHAPDGLGLLQPGHEGWEDYQDSTGATSNPGRLDPEMVSQVLGTPPLAEAHAAVYLSPITQGYLISAAVSLDGSEAAKDWLRNEAADRCSDGVRFFVDGQQLAILVGFNIDQDQVDAAAKAVKKASQADDLCQEAWDAIAAKAVRLDLGENGPFTIDDPSASKWFKIDFQKDAVLQIDVDSDAFVTSALYGPDHALIAYDDEGDGLGAPVGPGLHLFSVTEAGRDDPVGAFLLEVNVEA